MKITKEKVIYFLSLNVCFGFFMALFSVAHYFLSIFEYKDCIVCEISKEFDLNYFSFLFYYIFPIFISSFLFLLFSFISKNKKFKLFFYSLLNSIFISIFIFLSNLIFLFLARQDLKGKTDGLNLYVESMGFFIFSVILSVFIFIVFSIISYIILKITDPLRRKIVW